MKIALLNGPNLNLLGSREPEVYGKQGLIDIETRLSQLADESACELECFQSNAEHELVNYIHQARNQIKGIIINPGAFTHTSIVLRDAFLACEIPFIEVHISNVYARETFRHQSFLSDIASGVIVGCGVKGYELALQALINNLKK